ncbi:response regulator [Legionella fallonii]|uniref:Putative Response regulator receiver n=1 Tax=Legionella fallonii LLAP-10 TaxID=1212491 RepID=A0A098FZE9_9GAMM|nr:response regulator [Legionella fallonii]CEG55603.1 Putative Response regulator receiver [Legionella fallonii LLAP-10]
MRVLIVEDSAFNAFCLRRLLESEVTSVMVTIVHDSQAAMSSVNNSLPDIVIIDGDLGATDKPYCNGPELTETLLQKNPYLPIIAWSDSDTMREDFASAFMRHNRLLNEYNIWTKVVGRELICKTWAYYFDEFMSGQNAAFADNQANAGLISVNAT